MKYVDGVYPTPIYDAIVETVGKKDSATPSMWLSHPRMSSDKSVETIRYDFHRAASLSEVSLTLLRAGCHAEIYYVDRDNKTLPLLQTSRQAMAFDVPWDTKNASLLPALTDSRKLLDDLTWATVSSECYPVIVTALEIRLSRNKNELAPKTPYSLGLKDVLLKRSITTRQDAASPLPSTVDTIGNNVSYSVSDWAADKAVDDSLDSYWKSEPQPSPDAVVSLYLDVTDSNGDPQWIDHFYLDPVTAGQDMNVYWSNDDTEGPSLLSESAVLTTANNTAFIDNELTFPNANSKVAFSKSYLDNKKSHWVGLQWKPNYATGKTSTLWQNGNASLIHTSGELTLQTGSSAMTLAMPLTKNRVYNIAFALNMSDAPNQGRYLAFCEAGKTTIKSKDELGKPVFDATGNRLLTLNRDGVEETVPLSQYFTLLDNKLTPNVFTPTGERQIYNGDTLTLSIDPLCSSASETKKLSFTSDSSAKWGGRVSGSPLASDVSLLNGASVVKKTNIPHVNDQLCPNPLLEYGAAYLSTIIEDIAPLGNAVQIGTDSVFFDMQSYITGKKNERFLCTYLCKPIYGHGYIKPVLSSGTYDMSTPSLIETLANGWQRYSCTITLKASLASATLGFQVHAFDNEASAYLAAPSVVRDTPVSKTTIVDVGTSELTSMKLTYRHGPGELTVSIPEVVTTPAIPSYTNGTMSIGSCNGSLTAFILKQEAGHPSTMQSFLLSPLTYILPDPSPDGDPSFSTLSNALVVGRLSQEDVFRGGIDGTKFTSKVWTPILSDWTVSRRWFYLPYAIHMKYLKLEFTNLVMEPYPVWEDGIEVSYQVYPVSVTETSKSLATLDTTKVSVTTTTDTTKTQTTNGKTSTKALHDRAVTATSSLSTQLSEVDLPREYDVQVGEPISTSFPASSNIKLETDFHKETANSAIYKGTDVVTNSSTSSTSKQVARTVTKTWTETVVKPTTKWVAQDIYYTVKPGDYLLKIAQKLGIPDWRVIYAYNIWLQSDYRVAMLPSRPAGWWIFPGQVFRIPGAVMKQVTTYTTTKVTRKSTETVYDTVVDTTKTDVTTQTDTSIDREETLSTTRNRFRDQSVHRYAKKTVTRKDAYAYFVALRDVLVAKTNWLVERNTRLFDFVDYEAEGWTLTGISREGSVYRSSGEYTTGQLLSPTYSTISPFRTVKIVGSQRNSLRRNSPIPKIESYSPTPEPSPSAWASSTTTWKDTITPWGSLYEKPFVPLTVTKNGPTISITGGTGTDNVSVIASSWSAKEGETISGRMTVVPNSAISQTATMELRIVDLDNNETLAQWTGSETVLNRNIENNLDWPLYTATKDFENIGLVLILLNKGSLDWTVSNPVHSTGTMRILARNNSESTWEDVSQALESTSDQYTFQDRGRKLELRIEMADRADWISRLQVIPLYLTDDLRA